MEIRAVITALIHKGVSMSIIIADLASPEVNRGSFCYTPYLLYSAFNGINQNAYLYENVTIDEVDVLNECLDSDQLLVSLWSYPQIDLALAFHRLCNKKMYFFGYEPLIKKLGLPLFRLDKKIIVDGMKYYPYRLAENRFRHVLLSDCDLHLRSEQSKNECAKAYPMFTSYGCPRGCVFCSASKNTRHQRYILPLDDVYDGIMELVNAGVSAIHFTDEDFFYDPVRAKQILSFCHTLKSDMQIIALAHAHSFLKFYNMVELDNDKHEVSCLKLVEIGLETADDACAHNLNKARSLCTGDWRTIAENDICKVLFLTMTFYPGDNVNSMRKTGQFLKQYGLNVNALCPRIATNGTMAGLGQFYQYYDGCGDCDTIKKEGMILTDRPMRLLPSYLPNSFIDIPVHPDLNSICLLCDLEYWADINGIEKNIPGFLWQYINHPARPYTVIRDVIQQFPYVQQADIAKTFAVMARLGMIRSTRNE